MQKLGKLFVTPVDEMAEVFQIEVDLARDLEAGLFAEQLLAIAATAGGGVRPIGVGAPVDVVEVEPVDVQQFHVFVQAAW